MKDTKLKQVVLHGSAGGEGKTINIKYSDTDSKNNEKILNSLTDTVTLDIKESDVNFNTDENSTLSKIDKIIRKQLTDKGYDASTLVVQFIDDGFSINIHQVYVTLGQEKSRIIKVNYSNTLQYNKTDETYVKNKVNSIKFAKYGTMDAVFTIYDLDDEENANKWTRDTFDISKLLNDSSITVKKSNDIAFDSSETLWGQVHGLYFFKNDILYETKTIWNLGAYGTTLENGTPVEMVKLQKDDEIYKTMAKELEKNGLKTIIGCYELEAYGETYKNMKILFNIGNKYNSKEVKILHKKSDNTFETFTTKVENGKATITINEFSPFMIALNDTANNNNTSDKKLDDEPKTGFTDYTIFASVIALISLGGIITLKLKK